MKYYVKVDGNGKVMGSTGTAGDFSHAIDYMEIAEELFSVIHEKEYKNDVWVDIPKAAREISRKELIGLFKQIQRDNIASSSDSKVKGFLLWVQDGVDTEDPYFATALNAFENNLNLIGAGESARILEAAQTLAGVV